MGDTKQTDAICDRLMSLLDSGLREVRAGRDQEAELFLAEALQTARMLPTKSAVARDDLKTTTAVVLPFWKPR